MPVGVTGGTSLLDIYSMIDTFSVRQIVTEFVSPTARSYILDPSIPYPYTINTLVVKTAAGTATCAVQINGANVTGLSAVAASTTLTTATATGANTAAAGSEITLVLSNVTSVTSIAMCLRYTRT
jgi:hypothetical protein